MVRLNANEFNSNYFSLFNYLCNENTEISLKELTQKERERIKKTLDLIPPSGIETILDVGCCDGRLINLLEGKFKTTSLDIGVAGLRFVKGNKVVGSISNLPFSEKSFDLVICTEVFEHLPIKVLEKGLRELERVSKQYILISVPYKENIRKGYTRCRYCSKISHVYGHIHSFSKFKLGSMFKGLEIKHYETFGEKEANFGMDLVYYLKNKVGNKWAYSDKYLCPYCCKINSQGDEGNFFGFLIERLIWRIEKMTPFKNYNRISIVFQKGSKYGKASIFKK